jgi:hypothetical protein
MERNAANHEIVCEKNESKRIIERSRRKGVYTEKKRGADVGSI